MDSIKIIIMQITIAEVEIIKIREEKRQISIVLPILLSFKNMLLIINNKFTKKLTAVMFIIKNLKILKINFPLKTNINQEEMNFKIKYINLSHFIVEVRLIVFQVVEIKA
jgi:hypothetical protein